MVVNNFSLEEVIEYSRKYALRKSPKAARILDFNVDKPHRDYLNLCFTYLRFVDNFIDLPVNPVCEKRKFIEEQKLIISCFISGNIGGTLVAKRIEEACLFYFSEYAVKNKNTTLLVALQKMVDALEMDVCRLEDSRLFSNDEFDRYVKLMSRSLHNILHIFFSSSPIYLEEEFYINVFTANAQMIRDMEEDIDAGFINITREDAGYYKLNIADLKKDKNLSVWLKDRTDYLWKILYLETAQLKHSPLKFRFFIYYSMIYYLTWIVRAKVYDYDIQAYKKKIFTKEIRSYFLSFIKSVEIFLKGFIFTSNIGDTEKSGSIFDKFSPDLSFNEAFRISKNKTRKRAPKLWLICRLLVPKKKRKYVFLCFSYLRWVDDYIDNPLNQGKLEFVDNQLNLIMLLTKMKPDEFEDIKKRIKYGEEIFLYYSIAYAKSIDNYNLIYEGKRNIEAIRMDAVRLSGGGIFSRYKLEKYINDLVGPIFNLSYYLFFPSVKIKKNDKYLGKFLQYVLMLRDFFEDMDSGYINIPGEDIEKYNIDVNNIREDKNRIAWMIDKYEEHLKILEDEILTFKSLPLKLKLFWSPIYPYLISELIRIKYYDYNFGVKNKKDF